MYWDTKQALMKSQLDPHWFNTFFDSIYQLALVLDETGKVLMANQTLLNTTGLSQVDITGMSLWEIPWPVLSSQNRETLKQAVEQAVQGSFVRKELNVTRDGRPNLLLDFSLKPIFDEGQTLKFIVLEGQDVSMNTRTSEALSQSEARFRTIFEESGIGIVIKNVDGKILDANQAFLTMLGYTIDELKSLSYLEITSPLDRSVSQELFDELISSKRKNYTIEKRYIHKDGGPIWVYVTSSLVYGQNGAPQFVIAVAENINSQKQIESELEEVRRRLMIGSEMERLRIAQDLHDGPLQEIIGISYEINNLENLHSKNGERVQLESIQMALQSLAKSIRVICGELRPPTLIPFGLEKTIISHANELKAAHPELDVALDLSQDGQSLPEQQRIMLFRIYQEAFHNIIRHAQATKVWVRFKLENDLATLEVQDNGVGFKPPRRWIEFARQGHLGLVGAMERAMQAGGNVDVTSAAGQGTLIRASVCLIDKSCQEEIPESGGQA